MYKLYEKFLSETDKELSKFFDEQKPYICCKAGCSKCCSLGEYPLSRFEFQYLIDGFEKIDEKSRNTVLFQIKKLKNRAKNKLHKQKRFEHACPFLINGLCSVYSHRPLICRTFGLIKAVKTIDNQQIALLPDCLNDGLNYSKVFDFKNNCFDNAKIEKLSLKTQPKAYEISLPILFEKCEDKSINFEDRKNLIEFLLESDL